MSLLTNTSAEEASPYVMEEASNAPLQLTIIKQEVNTQKSAASDRTKERLKFEKTNMAELLTSTLKKKREFDESHIKWLDSETVELSNVSNLTIHSFILQAEALGKDITYSKQTTIKISN